MRGGANFCIIDEHLTKIFINIFKKFLFWSTMNLITFIKCNSFVKNNGYILKESSFKNWKVCDAWKD